MEQAILSNVELYYSDKFTDENVIVENDEFKHIIRVMRHTIGDIIYVTNGKGEICKCSISIIYKDKISATISEKFSYPNHLNNLTFCFPKLKSPDRFEFAIEKLTELGITNFIIFDAERSVSKTIKKERWEKLALSAMKQSLRSYLPEIKYEPSLKNIMGKDGIKIAFEQNSKRSLASLKIDKKVQYYLIFGPEGGLSDSELSLFDNDNNLYKLTNNRLRSETAIITAASILINISF